MELQKQFMNGMSFVFYRSECWTIFLHMKIKLETTVIYFFRNKLRIAETEHVSNEDILKKRGIKGHVYL